jgi:hypothetical protein
MIEFATFRQRSPVSGTDGLAWVDEKRVVSRQEVIAPFPQPSKYSERDDKLGFPFPRTPDQMGSRVLSREDGYAERYRQVV